MQPQMIMVGLWRSEALRIDILWCAACSKRSAWAAAVLTPKPNSNSSALDRPSSPGERRLPWNKRKGQKGCMIRRSGSDGHNAALLGRRSKKEDGRWDEPDPHPRSAGYVVLYGVQSAGIDL